MFNGFTPAAGDFLWELAFNNERVWFNEHKEQFEQTVNEPFKALAAETHTRQSIVLCHDNITWLYPVDQRKIHTVSTFVKYERLRTLTFDLVGSVTQDNDRDAELLCNLQS